MYVYMFVCVIERESVCVVLEREREFSPCLYVCGWVFVIESLCVWVYVHVCYCERERERNKEREREDVQSGSVSNYCNSSAKRSQSKRFQIWAIIYQKTLLHKNRMFHYTIFTIQRWKLDTPNNALLYNNSIYPMINLNLLLCLGAHKKCKCNITNSSELWFVLFMITFRADLIFQYFFTYIFHILIKRILNCNKLSKWLIKKIKANLRYLSIKFIYNQT